MLTINIDMPNQLTFNNHFKFGYNGEWFNQRQSPDDKFIAKFGRAESILTFSDAGVDASRKIAMSTDRPIYVCTSGGIDSEIVVKFFLKAKVNFTVAMLEFKNKENEHDLKYAYKLCDALGLRYKKFVLDVDNWYNSPEAIEIARRSTSCYITQLCQSWLLAQINEIGGFPVMGTGDPGIYRSVPSDFSYTRYDFTTHNARLEDDWYLHVGEDISCFAGAFLKTANLVGAPFFYCYTPELMYSYLTDNVIEQLVSDKTKFRFTTKEKYAIYSKYFGLEERPKYTGTEHLKCLEKSNAMLELINPHPTHIARYRYRYYDLLSLLNPAPESSR